MTEIIKDFNHPVCFSFPAGHGKRNLALTYGEKVETGATGLEANFGII